MGVLSDLKMATTRYARVERISRAQDNPLRSSFRPQGIYLSFGLVMQI
jgi:hypothetical protein